MQGVEAQTLANVYIALENDLEIIPVINKIDLPGSAALAPLDALISSQHTSVRLHAHLAMPCKVHVSGLLRDELQQVGTWCRR